MLMSSIVIVSPSFITIFVNLYSRYDVFVTTKSYSPSFRSKLYVPSGFISISWIISLGFSASFSSLVSDVLYTFIVAVCFVWSVACVITFPVIAGGLFCILTVYSFSSPAPFFTVTVTSVMFSFRLIFFWFVGVLYDVSPFLSFIFTCDVSEVTSAHNELLSWL